MPLFPIEEDPFFEQEKGKYGMPVPSRAYIQQVLETYKKPISLKTLCQGFGIKGQKSFEAMRRRVIAMQKSAQLLMDNKGRLLHVKQLDKITTVKGKVVINRNGSGGVEVERFKKNIFLPPKQMRQVFPGDEVEVQLIASGNDRGGKEAVIIRVLSHKTWFLRGQLQQAPDQSYFVEPLGSEISHRVQIEGDLPDGVQASQIVEVEITRQPTLESSPVGKVLVSKEELSPLHIALSQAEKRFDLPTEWPIDVELEVQKLPIVVDDLKGRKDLRKLPFVTIDGEDAKDFDDAVYAEKKTSGGWRLFVAIADVSYYVRPKSAIDTEAQKRSTSIYFPNHVIPMLPEELSNGLCSLKPHEDRYTLVCEMTVSQKGRLSGYRFYPAVIHSHARLTYTQVANVLEGEGDQFPEAYHSLVPNLEVLHLLYQTLDKRRHERGAIDFEVPEPVIELNSQHSIEKITQRERNVAHKLIEECMLLANVSAARFLLKYELPALFRVHEPPVEEKAQDLVDYLSLLGLKTPPLSEWTPATFNDILNQCRDWPDFSVIQVMLLRTMSQARYQPENLGHFGLAYNAYTHFTSPIRRYPDLVVHRAIRYLLDYQDPASYAYSLDNLEKLGVLTSGQERHADEASRFVVSLLKAFYVEQHVGDIFKGTVSGVTNFGMFVTLNDLLVDGLIHVATLKGDFYRFDAQTSSLIGERSNRTFSMGDQVTVQVARADPLTGKIDFELLASEPGPKKLK